MYLTPPRNLFPGFSLCWVALRLTKPMKFANKELLMTTIFEGWKLVPSGMLKVKQRRSYGSVVLVV